ncbi:G1/S-specific cyclin-D1 isoform X4 [Prinia subflava]|uniref:G1/S-specific cyclin-D1 isoform X4 n=1 Tax=Prinia subflava TaxID=208062 RepID=UPI002FE40863
MACRTLSCAEQSGQEWDFSGELFSPAELSVRRSSRHYGAHRRRRHARNARSRGGAAQRRGRDDIMRKWRPAPASPAAGGRRGEGSAGQAAREGGRESGQEGSAVGSPRGRGRRKRPQRASLIPHRRTGSGAGRPAGSAPRGSATGTAAARAGATAPRPGQVRDRPALPTGASGGGPAAAPALPPGPSPLCRRDRASPGRDLPVPPGNSPAPPLAPAPPLPAAAPPRGGSPGPAPAPPAAGTARPPRCPRPAAPLL